MSAWPGFTGRVIDFGGGRVTIGVDADTAEYAPESMRVRVVEEGAPTVADAVRALHSPRYFDLGPFGIPATSTVCAECRQTWPCATERAIADALQGGAAP